MKHKKTGSRRTENERDSVLRIAIVAVVALLFIAAIIVVVRVLNPRVDVEAGTKQLEQMSKKDVTKLDKKITEIEKAERAADEEWQNRPPDEKFANSIILGDSIAEGLYGYTIMDQSHVIARKGASVSVPTESGSMEDLQKAAEAKPQNLFFTYGMNDLQTASGEAAIFVENYKKFLDEARALLPDATLYVNSILPVQAGAAAADANLGHYPEFNEQLKQLCEKEEIVFIDQTESVKEEYYEPDGIHLASEFYLGWVNRMAEEADL